VIVSDPLRTLNRHNLPIPQGERAFLDPDQFRIRAKFKRACVLNLFRPDAITQPVPAQIQAANHVARSHQAFNGKCPSFALASAISAYCVPVGSVRFTSRSAKVREKSAPRAWEGGDRGAKAGKVEEVPSRVPITIVSGDCRRDRENHEACPSRIRRQAATGS
jgi:hypothetical protein